MNIVSRNEAKQLGLKRYFTGSPCKYGHTSERLVSSKCCVVCNQEKTKKFEADNPDKRREWHRKANANWRLNNPEASKELYKRSNANRRPWTKEDGKRHYQKYKAYFKQSAMEREAHVKQATPPWINRDDLIKVYQDCPEAYHVDHIIPLRGVTPEGWRVSGLNVPWNLQYLPASENLSKGNRVQAEDLLFQGDL